MLENSLFESLVEIKKAEGIKIETTSMYINFLNQIEGWKTRCKNLHWAAPKKNIHEYLDDFLSILQEYQDSIAEDYMGIEGKMSPDAIKGIPCDCTNANEFIREVKDKTIEFYNSLPSEVVYKGIASETENFIHNVNKFKYLFSLCDTNNILL